MSKTRLPCALVALAVVAALTGTAAGEPLPPGATFSTPVQMPAPPGFGGSEPSMVTDRAGNVWVTAHKTYYGLAASPDPARTAPVRSASWLWMSADGKSFRSPSGMSALDEQSAMFGDEGDLAVDAANNVYFADLTLAGSTFSAWSVAGAGDERLLHSSPANPIDQVTADRPFIAAGAAGHVVLVSRPLVSGFGTSSDSAEPVAEVPTRVFVSRDGGRNWLQTQPKEFANAYFCRPQVDVRPHSRAVYVLCVMNSNSIFSMVSTDGGQSWTRHLASATASGSGVKNFPSVGQGADGTLYALVRKDGRDGSSRLTLLTSRGGRVWSSIDVTPSAGQWRQQSLAVRSDGLLGMQAYYRRSAGSDWRIRASTFRPGSRPVATDVAGHPIAPSTASEPAGDFTQGAFGRDGKLRVVYAQADLDLDPALAGPAQDYPNMSQVFYAQQR